MSAPIDRTARSMTAGHPRPGFTARVMARIDAESSDGVMRAAGALTSGGPRHGFQHRVMARLDERAAVSGWVRPVLVGVSMAAALLAVVVWRTSRVTDIPAAPRAPKLTGYAYDRGPIGLPPLPEDRWPAGMTDVAGFEEIRTQRRASRANPLPPAPQIFRIAALDAPDDIAVKPIRPGLQAIPALEGPAPINVPELPGSAGSGKDSKEKP